MKVELEDLRLGLSELTETVYVGVLEKNNPMLWRHKKDVHNDFLHAVVTNWKNKKQTVFHGDYKYEIKVKATKIKK